MSAAEENQERESGVHYVPFYRLSGDVEMVPVPWGGDECHCPTNCPGNHSREDRKKIGVAIQGGKVRRTN